MFHSFWFSTHYWYKEKKSQDDLFSTYNGIKVVQDYG